MSKSRELSNGLVTVRLDAEEGTFDVLGADEHEVIAGAAFGVILQDGATFSTRGMTSQGEAAQAPLDDAVGLGSSLSVRANLGEGLALCATVTVYEGEPSVMFSCELHNDTSTPIRVARFEVIEGACLDLTSAPSTWRFYKHGWQSWSPTLVLDCAAEDVPTAAPVIAPGTRPEARGGRFVSEMMTTIVSPESGLAVVAGFVTAADQLSQVWLDRDGGRLTAASHADGISVPPGGRLSSERLLIEPTRTPLEAMERYGETLGRTMGAQQASDDVATGWCSWYHYWQGVTEEVVLANLRELGRRRDELPLDYVQIDDGWQAEIGDWLDVNEMFPRGLKWLADRIHEAGFRAGLWLAPFLMGDKSRLWQDHPEWAVEYRPAKPFIAMQNWGQDCYALDLTRPEVIEWLITVFRTVCEEWGFDYVKIDFVYAGAVDGIRLHPEVTRAQAYRSGLEAIRDAVGERFILGCGNPMGASVALVDGARISPDVAPFWKPPGEARDPERSRMSEPSALNAIRNTITRWWMHGRLWQNDPDCLLLRDSETGLTPDEVQTLATVIAMSGGMVLDSDDLTQISDERREWLSMLLPPYGKAARPLDLFESEMPRLLELDCGSHRMLAVFNWDDEAATIEAPVGTAVQVFDSWSGEDLGVREGSIELELAPHGCRLLAITSTTRDGKRANRALPRLFRWPGA